MPETVLEEELPRVWTVPLNICLDCVIDKIEQLEDLTTLSCHVDDPHEFLNTFYDLLNKFNQHSDKKIYPNQRGRFCSFSTLSDGADIPDELKDALFDFSEKRSDVRTHLFDSRLKLSGEIKKESPQATCQEIDGYVYRIHRDPSSHQNQMIRKHIAYIYEVWIAKQHDAGSLFPYFHKEQNAILFAIVFEERRRDMLIRLATKSLEELDGIATTVEKEKELCARVETLRKETQKLETELSAMSNERSLCADLAKLKHQAEQGASSLSSDLTRFLRKVFEGVVPQQDIDSHVSEFFEAGMPRNCETGYLGEAAVFKQFRASGLYDQVEWKNLSEAPTAESVTDAEGVQFFVAESSAPYDIVAHRKDGGKVYVEVKSTFHEIYEERWPIHLSESQIELLEGMTGANCGVLALVFNPRRQCPMIRYLQVGPFPTAQTSELS
jgi:hypothetical protein